MGSPWTQHSGHIPNDNFKIQQDNFLSKPIGRFVEEIMYWANQERCRLGMTPWTYYLYDEYTPPPSGEPDESLHDGWTPESGQPSGEDPDTQRISFTPGISGGPSGFLDDGTQACLPEVTGSGVYLSNLVGYYAFLANYVTDIVDSFIGADPSGNPLSHKQGLFQNIYADFEDSVQHFVPSPRTNFITLGNQDEPEFDVDLNMLRPKFCIACLDNDRIKIVNLMAPWTPIGGGENAGVNAVGNENILCNFGLRNEDDELILTGANLLAYDNQLTPSFYIAYGATIRRFDTTGRAIKHFNPGLDYTITLPFTPSSMQVDSDKIYYISAGNYYEFDIATETNEAFTIRKQSAGRTILDYSPNVGDTGPDENDPNSVDDYVIDTLSFSSVVKFPSTTMIGDIGLIDNTIMYLKPTTFTSGIGFVTQAIELNEEFENLVWCNNTPRALTHFTTVSGIDAFNNDEDFLIYLGTNGGDVTHLGFHTFSNFGGTDSFDIESFDEELANEKKILASVQINDLEFLIMNNDRDDPGNFPGYPSISGVYPQTYDINIYSYDPVASGNIRLLKTITNDGLEIYDPIVYLDDYIEFDASQDVVNGNITVVFEVVQPPLSSGSGSGALNEVNASISIYPYMVSEIE